MVIYNLHEKDEEGREMKKKDVIPFMLMNSILALFLNFSLTSNTWVLSGRFRHDLRKNN